MDSAAAKLVPSVTDENTQDQVRKPSGQFGGLIQDAMLLARHAMDSGVLTESTILERLVWLDSRCKSGVLKEEEIAEAVRYYETLNNSVGEVSVESIKATDAIRDGYWRSVAGRHLITLWSITFLVGALIFFYSMLEYRVSYFDLGENEMITEAHMFWVRLQHYSNFLVPFTYGALGACAYLLRVVEHRLKTREFNPSRIPQHWNRLVLGTLSGGMVVMFLQQLPGSENSTVHISEGALGFLAGYSIDFLFNILDRVISAILPKVSSDSGVRTRDQRSRMQLVYQYQRRLAETQDPGERKALTAIIEDLKG